MADSTQSLGDNLIVGEGGVLLAVGSIAWAVAVIAAAMAIHGVGAPLSASVLLGLSAIVVSHPPPIGPVGLVFFAAAIAIWAQSERTSSALPATGAPAPGAA